MSFSQLLAILKARKYVVWWIIFLTVVTTAVVSFLLPKTYQATASLVINAKGADPVSGAMLPAMLLPGYMATQVDILESQNVSLKVVDKVGVTNSESAVAKFEESGQSGGDIRLWYAEKFMKNLDVNPSRKSNLIEVSYSGGTPEFAAQMANAFAQAYIETNLELKTKPAKQAAVFFDSQLKRLRSKVEDAQAKLTAYQEERGITATLGRLDVETARLAELSSQLVAAQAKTYDSRSRQKSSSSNSQDVLSDPLVQGLKSNLANAEAKLSDLSQRLGFNHPQYQAAKEEVNSLRRSLNNAIFKSKSGVNQGFRVSELRERELRSAVENQKKRVLSLQSEQDEMAALLREAETAQKIYDSALLKFGQADLESQSGQTDIAILNIAKPPMTHSSPKRLLNLVLSFVLGGLLSILVAVLSELMDRKVRVAEDLSSSLEIPVLADLTKPKAGILSKLKSTFKVKKRITA